MNDTLQNIMLFINEHTILLIGICVFLILVLVGYLIDNSVKSKRVRNDIKNKDQVPENIKEEIIEEAKKTKKFENAVMEKNELANAEIGPETKAFLEEQVDKQISNSPLNIDNNTINNNIEDNSLNLNEQNNLNLDGFVSSDVYANNDLIQENIQNEVTVDPDYNIMNANDNGFKNDKKLSEILSEVNYTYNNQINDSTNITSINDNSSEIPIINNENNVIENTQDIKQSNINNNADEELDRIMRKLSSMNKIEDDNYTNIF